MLTSKPDLFLISHLCRSLQAVYCEIRIVSFSMEFNQFLLLIRTEDLGVKFSVVSRCVGSNISMEERGVSF